MKKALRFIWKILTFDYKLVIIICLGGILYYTFGIMDFYYMQCIDSCLSMGMDEQYCFDTYCD